MKCGTLVCGSSVNATNTTATIAEMYKYRI
jgi:hypothetical protein